MRLIHCESSSFSLFLFTGTIEVVCTIVIGRHRNKIGHRGDPSPDSDNLPSDRPTYPERPLPFAVVHRGGFINDAKSGFAKWVADSSGLLNLEKEFGELPEYPLQWPWFGQSISDEVSAWYDIAKKLLESRWISPLGGRYYVRKIHNLESQRKIKTGKIRPGSWLCFPHPKDIHQNSDRALSGVDGQVPCIKLQIFEKDNRGTLEYTLQTEGIIPLRMTDVLDNDIQIPSDLFFITESKERQPWEDPNISKILVDWLDSLPNTQLEINEDLVPWRNYLHWIKKQHTGKEWFGQILNVTRFSPENPYHRVLVKVKSEDREKILNSVKKGPKERTLFFDSPSEYESEGNWFKQSLRVRRGRKAGTLNRGLKKSNFELLAVDDVPHDARQFQQASESDEFFTVLLKLNPPNVEDPTSGGIKEKHKGWFIKNSVFSDIIQYERQSDALDRLSKLNAAGFNNVHNWLFDIGKAKSGPNHPPELEHATMRPLNEQQELAIRGALAAEDVYLIQGPPGTGKTTVIAEIINQICSDNSGKKVLLASQTNLAVANALGRLSRSTDVRPLFTPAQSHIPQAEAQNFVEDNVVKDFFVPSLIENCMKDMTKDKIFQKARDSIRNCQEELEIVYDSWVTNSQEVTDITNDLKELDNRITDLTTKFESLSEDLDIIQRTDVLFSAGDIPGITESMASAIGLEYQKILDISRLSVLIQEKVLISKILDFMDKSPTVGTTDPKIRKLHNNMDTAVSEQNFELAADIRDKIKALQSEVSDDDSFWTNWTRGLSDAVKGLRTLESEAEIIDMVDALSGSIRRPEDLGELVTYISQKSTENVKSLDLQITKFESTKEKTEGLIEESIENEKGEANDSISKIKSELENEQEKRSEILEKLDRANRRVARLESRWADLVGALPPGIAEEHEAECSGSIPSQILAKSESWLSTNSKQIADSESWSGIRSDWIEQLENSTKETLTDLKIMYLEMVNVRGVTTSISGRPQWYEQSALNPFDVVIIDEISKCTPPELLMPLLLGRKAILVGDHRQLPPTFSPPGDRDVSGSKLLLKSSKKEINEYRDFVTSSQFAKYFQDANSSLKTTLTEQYRMHSQIMQAVNLFYEDRLVQGKPDTDTNISLDQKKKHGFRIVKPDSGGDPARGKGSDLIKTNNHIVWIDSSFDRDFNYCNEEKPPNSNSRQNKREIRLAKSLLDSLNEQITNRKSEIPREDWGSDDMLQHLVDERLPVGFITFYGAQIQAFKRISLRNKPLASARAVWSELSLKVDTVDGFQGGERPVVIVSTVISPDISDEAANKIKLKLKEGEKIETLASKKKIFPKPSRTFISDAARANVAISRAQNLLIILGNRWALGKLNDIEIIKDDGSTSNHSSYRDIHSIITNFGGTIDGRDLR